MLTWLVGDVQRRDSESQQRTPRSEEVSKRIRSSEASAILPSTPTDGVSCVDVEKLSTAVGGLLLEDTPKSRPRPTPGIAGKGLGGKILFSSEGHGTKDQHITWSDGELKALTCFLLLYTDGKSWVAHKESRFWDRAGIFIQQQLHTSHCRSGMYHNACKHKCVD